MTGPGPKGSGGQEERRGRAPPSDELEDVH